MTTETQSQQVDLAALVAQINTLKQQRSAAMDDVAVLVGEVTSLRKQLEAALGQTNTPASSDGGASYKSEATQDQSAVAD